MWYRSYFCLEVRNGTKNIGEAAKEAGVNVETIRFYERRDLIEQPVKPAGGGFRSYDHTTATRIRFVRQVQEIGFSLSEIADLLALRTDPAADCDAARAEAADTIATLRKSRIRTILITSDNQRTGECVARELGIDEIHTGVLPGEKAQLIRKLQEKGRTAMVGPTASTTRRR